MFTLLSAHLFVVFLVQFSPREVCVCVGSFQRVFSFLFCHVIVEGAQKGGERNGGDEWGPDKLLLASPPRQAEQQIAVALDGGALARVSPRPPSVSPLLASTLLLRGDASELLEITLMKRAQWQSAHSHTLYLKQFIPANVCICLFFPPQVMKERRCFFSFLSLCSDSRLLDTP